VFQGKEKNYKVNWRPTKHSSNLNERVATCWSFRNSYFGSNFWHATEQTINWPDWATTPGETYRTCCSFLKYWTFFIAVCSTTVCELVFCYSQIIFSDTKKIMESKKIYLPLNAWNFFTGQDLSERCFNFNFNFYFSWHLKSITDLNPNDSKLTHTIYFVLWGLDKTSIRFWKA
jgi:hypothetical protein